MSMILCLETSGKWCSVALSNNGQLAAYRESKDEWSHSKQITLMIQAVLSESNISISELSAVAISKGPGSYTGLRVGASCAKGICFTKDIPLLAIPTLQLIAAEIVTDEADVHLVPMIDARRQEVYYAVYDNQLNERQEANNKILDEAAFQDKSHQKLIFCGDGAFKMDKNVQNIDLWSIHESHASAKYMPFLASERLKKSQIEDTAYFIPFYLKPPNITKSKKTLI